MAVLSLFISLILCSFRDPVLLRPQASTACGFKKKKKMMQHLQSEGELTSQNCELPFLCESLQGGHCFGLSSSSRP